MPKVDVQFKVTGKKIFADHGYLLLAAISDLCPEIHSDPEVGVFPINGQLIGARELAVTEQSRLSIRIEAERIKEILGLAGKRLIVGGDQIGIGTPNSRALLPKPVLYSRLAVIKGYTEPEAFLEAARRQMDKIGISGQMSLVAQRHVPEANRDRRGGSRSPYLRRTVRIRDKTIVGFAVRVENLTADESILLQEKGLGGRRRFGCGLFVPAESS